jgi:serine-type D-Ala-D-Ala carboxypeptidase (penicillin-binding protein 5/6)
MCFGEATDVPTLLRRAVAPLAAVLLAAGLLAEPALAAPAPQVQSKHAALIDAASGAVLWQRAEHEPTLVASTTKVLTALVAQETWPPQALLTVPEAAERVDGTRLGYQAGMRIRRRDLIGALLQVSANDAAETLAGDYPRGGRAGFIRAMQAKADALGCTDSTWRDPSGLEAPGHRVSAADLAIVGRALLGVPELAAVVAQRELRYPWPNGRIQVVVNHNHFVSEGQDPGALGIKTGFTDAALHTIVAAQRRGGRTLIAVALGAPSALQDRDDVRAMFRFGFATPARPGAEILGAKAAKAQAATAPAGAAAQGAPSRAGAAAALGTPRHALLRSLQASLLIAPVPLAVLAAILMMLIGVMTVRSSGRARSRARAAATAPGPAEDAPPYGSTWEASGEHLAQDGPPAYGEAAPARAYPGRGRAEATAFPDPEPKGTPAFPEPGHAEEAKAEPADGPEPPASVPPSGIGWLDGEAWGQPRGVRTRGGGR